MLLETKQLKLHGFTATLAAGVMTDRHKGRKVTEGLGALYKLGHPHRNFDREDRSLM
jgi:hypothetical protein